MLKHLGRGLHSTTYMCYIHSNNNCYSILTLTGLYFPISCTIPYSTPSFRHVHLNPTRVLMLNMKQSISTSSAVPSRIVELIFHFKDNNLSFLCVWAEGCWQNGFHLSWSLATHADWTHGRHLFDSLHQFYASFLNSD